MQKFSLKTTKKIRPKEGVTVENPVALFKFMNDLLRVAGLTANEHRGTCQLPCGSANRGTAPS